MILIVDFNDASLGLLTREGLASKLKFLSKGLASQHELHGVDTIQ